MMLNSEKNSLNKHLGLIYTYEWNHSVIDVVTKNAVADDSEWLHSKKPLRPGQIWTIYSERRSVDLDAEDVDRGKWYFLDCYTEINVNGVKGSWKVKQQTTPFRH